MAVVCCRLASLRDNALPFAGGEVPLADVLQLDLSDDELLRDVAGEMPSVTRSILPACPDLAEEAADVCLSRRLSSWSKFNLPTTLVSGIAASWELTTALSTDRGEETDDLGDRPVIRSASAAAVRPFVPVVSTGDAGTEPAELELLPDDDALLPDDFSESEHAGAEFAKSTIHSTKGSSVWMDASQLTRPAWTSVCAKALQEPRDVEPT